MKYHSILEAIGRTPLIRLNRVSKDVPAEIYVKADYLNPGGSVKDRIAVTMIDEAERKGLLKPGGTIIEGTSGIPAWGWRSWLPCGDTKSSSPSPTSNRARKSTC